MSMSDRIQMKKPKTMRRVMNELFAIANNPDISKKARDEAYNYASALQWATTKTTWNLFGLLRGAE